MLTVNKGTKLEWGGGTVWEGGRKKLFWKDFF